MQTVGQDGEHSRPSITGVIVARNEADKVMHALASVRPILDELLFCDMESSDATAAIAASFGATVIPVALATGQEPVRPAAVAKASGEWVLMFDADEVIEPRLRETLLRIARQDEADVVSLPRFNYLFGKPMYGALMGANDDRQIRFFKKGAVEVTAALHVQPVVQPGARLKELTFQHDGAIIHFNYVDIDNYLTKFIRYTYMESRKPSAAAKYKLFPTILKMGWEFVNRYLRKGGYRDGWRGFYIAASMSFYRLTIWARVCEMEDVGTREQIQSIYSREAARSVRENH
ncbi:Glycosyltransferase involved in cell wall bisynthesis [Bryocella elongata]|uniref:Glycosyltransferase involved in cell wall bisynthesis n=1 Tax=Bryocella elongata TaxID=863522 RepID=A0A1H5ZBQ4_9BACT|nr:glycosyltransferase family 2 protein [Bryocella elongata]SEG33165.1 Glycosyltransferase involved in cell wall bisynthesis [Bryocella elongata]